jgi:deoxycytidylate deaminase
MGRCKRLTVTAVGIDALGKTAYARNFNYGECTAEPGNCGCIHAEAALLEVMSRPIMVMVSHSPCVSCAEKLINAGVLKVSYHQAYRIRDGIYMLRKNRVKVTKLSDKQWAEATKYIVAGDSNGR